MQCTFTSLNRDAGPKFPVTDCDEQESYKQVVTKRRRRVATALTSGQIRAASTNKGISAICIKHRHPSLMEVTDLTATGCKHAGSSASTLSHEPGPDPGASGGSRSCAAWWEAPHPVERLHGGALMNPCW